MNDSFNELMGRLAFGGAYPYVNFLLSGRNTFQPEQPFTEQIPQVETPRPYMTPEQHARMKAYWDAMERQSQTSPYENVSDYPYYWANGMPLNSPVPQLGYGY